MQYYIGNDEIVGGEGHAAIGYDYSEIFGGDMVLGADSPGLVSEVAQARAAGGVAVVKRQPSTLREQSLPFNQAYTASQTANVTLTPQRMFRPERLTFASLTALYFLLNSVNIAQEPQFVADGATLCQLFTEVAVGMRLKGKTANLGAQITLGLTNLDAVNARTVYGQIVGPAVL
jgi:hypothetical protein